MAKEEAKDLIVIEPEIADGAVAEVEKGKSRGNFGLGPCFREEQCKLCQAAAKEGEWLFAIARNAYLDGCEPWIVADIIEDYAAVEPIDVQKHAFNKQWFSQRADSPAGISRLAVWNIALRRYRRHHKKSANDQTADKMVEVLAKLAGVIGSGTRVETKTEVNMNWEDRLLQVRHHDAVDVPRDDDSGD